MVWHAADTIPGKESEARICYYRRVDVASAAEEKPITSCYTQPVVTMVWCTVTKEDGRGSDQSSRCVAVDKLELGGTKLNVIYE